MKVTFIGLGIMGSNMASNLVKKGVNLTVYNRTRGKMDELISLGAKGAESIEAAVKDADVVFTMLSTPEAVDEMAYGENGFLKYMKKNSIWVDSSTVNPSFSVKMSKLTKDMGIRFMDAPVSGSKIPAQNGELIFLVGGEEKDLEEVRQFLEMMGKKVLYIGENGSGASMKMVVNLMLGASMEIFSEAVLLGEKLGISRDFLLDTLPDMPVSAPILKAKKEKIKNSNFEEEFPLELMHKDFHLVALSAYENNISMKAANVIKEIYADAKSKGLGREDISAIYKSLKI